MPHGYYKQFFQIPGWIFEEFNCWQHNCSTHVFIVQYTVYIAPQPIVIKNCAKTQTLYTFNLSMSTMRFMLLLLFLLFYFSVSHMNRFSFGSLYTCPALPIALPCTSLTYSKNRNRTLWFWAAGTRSMYSILLDFDEYNNILNCKFHAIKARTNTFAIWTQPTIFRMRILCIEYKTADMVNETIAMNAISSERARKRKRRI